MQRHPLLLPTLALFNLPFSTAALAEPTPNSTVGALRFEAAEPIDRI